MVTYADRKCGKTAKRIPKFQERTCVLRDICLEFPIQQLASYDSLENIYNCMKNDPLLMRRYGINCQRA